MTDFKTALTEWRNVDFVARGLRSSLGKMSLVELYDEISIGNSNPRLNNTFYKLLYGDIRRCNVYDVIDCMIYPSNLLPWVAKRLIPYKLAYQVYVYHEIYTCGELKALVHKNHGIRPTQDNDKMLWAIAFVETQRYGFNTFAVKSPMNDDVLTKIKSFV
jgi:hypothetical protein